MLPFVLIINVLQFHTYTGSINKQRPHRNFNDGFGDRIINQLEISDLINNLHPDRNPISRTIPGKT